MKNKSVIISGYAFVHRLYCQRGYRITLGKHLVPSRCPGFHLSSPFLHCSQTPLLLPSVCTPSLCSWCLLCPEYSSPHLSCQTSTHSSRPGSVAPLCEGSLNPCCQYTSTISLCLQTLPNSPWSREGRQHSWLKTTALGASNRDYPDATSPDNLLFHLNF